MPNERPDVTVVKKDGTINRTEVRSTGRSTEELQEKQSDSRNALGNRAGQDTVVEPDPPTPPPTPPAEEVTPLAPVEELPVKLPDLPLFEL